MAKSMMLVGVYILTEKEQIMKKRKFRVFAENEMFSDVTGGDLGSFVSVDNMSLTPVDCELMEAIGAKDSSQWDDLTIEEKNYFRSPDGKTIKYENDKKAEKAWRGKDIYEDDIVRYGNSREYVYVIRYIQEECKYYAVGITETQSENNLGYKINPRLRVIGNIHENPELLENAN